MKLFSLSLIVPLLLGSLMRSLVIVYSAGDLLILVFLTQDIIINFDEVIQS